MSRVCGGGGGERVEKCPECGGGRGEKGGKVSRVGGGGGKGWKKKSQMSRQVAIQKGACI